ncbi:MAG: hybrid sensor histidine kinase/response regulator [Cyanobacteriota bacterium]|nr:hybrid sensor histidine kinase/response regulator [Cyanobacteriota bacterium]
MINQTLNPTFSILVIDDDPTNFDVIEALLGIRISTSDKPFHYQLHYAASGREAIDSLEFYQPDLILLDVMMPDMDGIETCRQIKSMSMWQPTPIIMVTALNSKDDLARCLQSGADDFVSKPINGVELGARVLSMLRIKKQYDNLQNLLRLREDIVQMIIHDLRNPLTNILFGLDLLEKMPLTREQQAEKVTRIKKSGRQLQSLIDDLLLTAKMESGKLQLNLTEVDFGSLVRSVVLDFEEALAQKKIEFICDLPESSYLIQLDASLFRRVMDNLLSNAIKFSPTKGRITINITRPQQNSITIAVADSGKGVPDNLKEKIFEKYEIGTPIQDTPQLGLGLAFCKMVVEAHQGQVRARNNQPTGTIFELTLPV